MAIRQGDWKLVRYDATVDTAGARSGRREAVPRSPRRGCTTSPRTSARRDDLAARAPGKVKELQAAWQEWDAELARPLWGPGSGREARAGRPRSRGPRP